MKWESRYYKEELAPLAVATGYYMNALGHVVTGWTANGNYAERLYMGYSLKEIREKLATEHVRYARTFKRRMA